jgi:hypothetical protein
MQEKTAARRIVVDDHPEAGKRAVTAGRFVTFLACPKKGDPKKGTPAVVLVRAARSSSVRFENSPFEQVKLSGLGQFETLDPRPRSQHGNGRMGRPVKVFDSPKPRAALMRWPWEGMRSAIKESQRTKGRRACFWARCRSDRKNDES